jgi:glycosyltransferase involved in cell wall biosynthesis
MSSPLVSVVVPTKNSAAYLGLCLRSIDEQSYKPIELIVVDNNSNDNTKIIARSFTKKVYNYGPERSAQRNLGARHAKGKYLLFIDSDMVLTPRVVEGCVNKISKQPGLKALIIPEKSFGIGFWAKCKALERTFYEGLDWMEAARFVNREVFNKVGGYDESNTGTEDYDLPQRIEVVFPKPIGRINEVINHNEQKLNLIKTCKKKYYYGQNVMTYKDKSENKYRFQLQASPFQRYKLFFSKPAKLFKEPLTGLGMLFMKICEFTSGGAGYLVGRIRG